MKKLLILTPLTSFLWASDHNENSKPSNLNIQVEPCFAALSRREETDSLQQDSTGCPEVPRLKPLPCPLGANISSLSLDALVSDSLAR